MWAVISKISQQRKQSAVILTTHSMEEAEALSHFQHELGLALLHVEPDNPESGDLGGSDEESVLVDGHQVSQSSILIAFELEAPQQSGAAGSQLGHSVELETRELVLEEEDIPRQRL